MNVDQFQLEGGQMNFRSQAIEDGSAADFVLVFSSREQLEKKSWIEPIKAHYPEAAVISCSTSGEIYASQLLEDSFSAMAVQLQKSSSKVIAMNLEEREDSFETGVALATKFDHDSLSHLLVFSDGWLVDGAKLIEGMYSVLPKNVSISGGMAGDGANFQETVVGLEEDVRNGNVVAIAFYGEALQVGFGSHGGWNTYSNPMKVTRSDGRAIYELDGQPALPVYKEFLGKDAVGLPGTALLYPVAVTTKGKEEAVSRTVYNIDELDQSIILGSPVPDGADIYFMRAEFDDIMQGAASAAENSMKLFQQPADFALVVSCIGRKLLFDQEVEEEIATTKNVLGASTPVAGFYSYGEICPIQRSLADLHHQMLTVTVFREN